MDFVWLRLNEEILFLGRMVLEAEALGDLLAFARIVDPAVEQDVAEAFKRYDEVSPVLGDEFKRELRHFIEPAAASPGRFHPTKSRFRRANVRRFPSRCLCCELPDGIRVTLVRHHKRHPDHGLDRE